MYALYDYDLMYSNLSLSDMEDEELYRFSLGIVRHFLKGLYLLNFTGLNGGAKREFDLDNYEVSELALSSANLLEGFTKTGRRRYQDLVDNFLFRVSLFEGGDTSVRGTIKQSIAKEIRQAVRDNLNKRGVKGEALVGIGTV